MQLFAVITSDKEGMIPDYGTVKPDKPIVVDQYKMIRIEAKRKLRFFEIELPVGVSCTLHVLDDDDAELVI